MSNRVSGGYLHWLWLVPVLLMLATAADVQGRRSLHQRVDGVDIYLGVLPAEMIRGHPKEHPEGEMHGGTPVGMVHVMAALFDQASGKRITDASVTARLEWPDQYRVEKPLEPMIVSASKAYGNYFRVPDKGSVRIVVTVQRPGRPGVVKATFYWGST
jgi:hypothetical protein